MYTHGSNALKTEYYTQSPRQKKQTENTAVRNAKASRRKVRMMKKRAVSLLVIAFSMAFIVLFRYAAITNEYDKLMASREKLESLNASIVEKQMKAEGNLDHRKVAQEAERLGLKPPAKNQIKYISLGNTDNGEVLKVEEQSSFSAFINRISVILEYLY